MFLISVLWVIFSFNFLTGSTWFAFINIIVAILRPFLPALFNAKGSRLKCKSVEFEIL